MSKHMVCPVWARKECRIPSKYCFHAGTHDEIIDNGTNLCTRLPPTEACEPCVEVVRDKMEGKPPTLGWLLWIAGFISGILVGLFF